jgi:pimeloyl-ACP methyl ester carboxylesterase
MASVELRDYCYYSIFVIVFIVSIVLLICIQSQNNMADAQISPLVSTRSHFNLDTGELRSGHNGTDYDASDIPGLQPGTSCPKEAAIYVHGVWTGMGSFSANLENETGIFDRARMSLAVNNYSIPVIGFSWDSNTTITANEIGWSIAKKIAQDNGPKLADFLFDYKSTCPDTDVRIIAHSLGAKVVLSALQDLNDNQGWNSSRNFNIESIHLMGAAVDDEQVSTNTSDADDPGEKVYGQSIESQVIRFYNLFDTQDNALEEPYPYYEGGETALGLNGAEQGVSLPRNYQDIDVTKEISILNDANGDNKCDLPNPFIPNYCTIAVIGDNHLGYVGFVSSTNGNLVDDGAMNIVVEDWSR